MKIRVKSHDFEPTPAGSHVAICTGVIDIGWQRGNGKYGDKPETVLQLELPRVRFKYQRDGVEIEGARIISRRYRTSMERKSGLRQLLAAWIGFPNDDAASEFDLKSLLDRRCLLNVVHVIGNDGRTYANIEGAAPLPADLDSPDIKREGELLYYECGISGPDELSALPQWLRTLIVNRLPEPTPKPVERFDAGVLKTNMTVPAEDFDDEVPF